MALARAASAARSQSSPSRSLAVRAARWAQLRGGGVAGGGERGGAGASGAFGGADQCGDGLVADLVGVGIVGDGVERVEVVAGDDVGYFFPVAGEGSAQVGGHGEVPGLAVAAGQGVVGDLPEHLLGEPVAAPLG